MNHIHWSGIVDDIIPYDGQDLTVGFSTDPEDPIGTVAIWGAGALPNEHLHLPNSTQESPTWDAIPGTTPPLQARQDGHFDTTLVLIRPAP